MVQTGFFWNLAGSLILTLDDLGRHDCSSPYALPPVRCFLFAEMPWYQRKIASVIFTSPPTSSYEEVSCFVKETGQGAASVGRCLICIGNPIVEIRWL